MAEFGRALLLAGVAAALAAVCTARRWLLGAAALAVAASVGVLAWASLTTDLSFAVVAATTRRGANAWYRLSALWGGPEGALLVFVLATAVVAWVAARRADRPRERRLLAAPVALLGALALAVADAFSRTRLPPIDGAGLAPILEHPAMAIHPPLLYAGLVATLPPFASAVAARDGAMPSDAERQRRWLLVAAGTLAAAMAVGALWSYAEAGWGGAWAWDPVENTSLLVWLLAVAGLHASRAGAALGRWAAWPWVAVLAGAAVTRGGATVSVHAFAEDPALGRTLGVLAALSASGAVMASQRLPPRRSPGGPGRPGPAVGAVLAGLAVLVVALGTAAPLVRRVMGDPGTAVEGWFYSRVLAPAAVVGLLALVLIGVAGAAPRRRPWAATGAGLVGVLTAGAATAGGWPLASALIAACGASATVASVTALRHGPAWVAHAGVALVLTGTAGMAAGTATSVTLSPGEQASVGPVSVRLEGVEVVAGPRQGTEAVVAVVTLADGGTSRAARPALVAYPSQGGVLAETALWSRPWRDVQVHLVDADDGRALLTVRVRPLAGLVWVGAGLVALGALLSAYDARRAARMLVPPSSAPGCSQAQTSQSTSAAHQSG